MTGYGRNNIHFERLDYFEIIFELSAVITLSTCLNRLGIVSLTTGFSLRSGTTLTTMAYDDGSGDFCKSNRLLIAPKTVHCRTVTMGAMHVTKVYSVTFYGQSCICFYVDVSDSRTRKPGPVIHITSTLPSTSSTATTTIVSQERENDTICMYCIRVQLFCTWQDTTEKRNTKAIKCISITEDYFVPSYTACSKKVMPAHSFALSLKCLNQM